MIVALTTTAGTVRLHVTDMPIALEVGDVKVVFGNVTTEDGVVRTTTVMQVDKEASTPGITYWKDLSYHEIPT